MLVKCPRLITWVLVRRLADHASSRRHVITGYRRIGVDSVIGYLARNGD
jgi:hypothetical protein